MATLTLSKSSSKYSIAVEYYGQVEKNVGSVRIGLYFRDVGEINTTVGSHLKAYRYGIPDEIVSSEFQQFSKDYGFQHTCTSPHHHQANGKTESTVKQAKKTMPKAKTSGNDPQMALLDVRNTPIEGYGASPAQLIMHEQANQDQATNLRKPPQTTGSREHRGQIQKRQNNQRKYYNEHSKTLDTLKEDEKKWTKAQVMEQIGTRSYKVQTEENTCIRNGKHP